MSGVVMRDGGMRSSFGDHSAPSSAGTQGRGEASLDGGSSRLSTDRPESRMSSSYASMRPLSAFQPLENGIPTRRPASQVLNQDTRHISGSSSSSASMPQLTFKSADLRSALHLHEAQKHKLYMEGYLLVRHALSVDGQPAHRPDQFRTWTECFVQLNGTVLSIWESRALAEAEAEGREVPPSFINITDALVDFIGLHVEAQFSDPGKRRALYHVFAVNSAGSNRVLFCYSTPPPCESSLVEQRLSPKYQNHPEQRLVVDWLNTGHRFLQAWINAIRLASWERSRLDEIYTGALIRARLSAVRNMQGSGAQPGVDHAELLVRSPLVRGRHEGWVRARFMGSTEWRMCWMVLQSHWSEDEPVSGLRRLLKRGAGDRSSLLSLAGGLHHGHNHGQVPLPDMHEPPPPPAGIMASPAVAYFYDHKKAKKPFASLWHVRNVYAVYPSRPDLVEGSVLFKVEGSLPQSTVLSATHRPRKTGWVMFMPELKIPQTRGANAEMMKWIIAFMDAFRLYGRPGAFAWDARNPASPFFAYPIGPYKDHLFLDRALAEFLDITIEDHLTTRQELHDIMAARMRGENTMLLPPLPPMEPAAVSRRPTTVGRAIEAQVQAARDAQHGAPVDTRTSGGYEEAYEALTRSKESPPAFREVPDAPPTTQLLPPDATSPVEARAAPDAPAEAHGAPAAAAEARAAPDAAAEARAAHAQAQAEYEAQARALAELEARAQAQAEAKARAQAEHEARLQAEHEARTRAELEASVRREQEARLLAEQEARAQARARASLDVSRAPDMAPGAGAARASFQGTRAPSTVAAAAFKLQQRRSVPNDPWAPLAPSRASAVVPAPSRVHVPPPLDVPAPADVHIVSGGRRTPAEAPAEVPAAPAPGTTVTPAPAPAPAQVYNPRHDEVYAWPTSAEPAPKERAVSGSTLGDTSLLSQAYSDFQAAHQYAELSPIHEQQSDGASTVPPSHPTPQSSAPTSAPVFASRNPFGAYKPSTEPARAPEPAAGAPSPAPLTPAVPTHLSFLAPPTQSAADAPRAPSTLATPHDARVVSDSLESRILEDYLADPSALNTPPAPGAGAEADAEADAPPVSAPVSAPATRATVTPISAAPAVRIASPSVKSPPLEQAPATDDDEDVYGDPNAAVPAYPSSFGHKRSSPAAPRTHAAAQARPGRPSGVPVSAHAHDWVDHDESELSTGLQDATLHARPAVPEAGARSSTLAPASVVPGSSSAGSLAEEASPHAAPGGLSRPASSFAGTYARSNHSASSLGVYQHQGKAGSSSSLHLERPRQTFVRLGPDDHPGAGAAYVPQGLLASASQERLDRRAHEHEQRGSGAALVNVPTKPPPPQAGLMGAIHGRTHTTPDRRSESAPNSARLNGSQAGHMSPSASQQQMWMNMYYWQQQQQMMMMMMGMLPQNREAYPPQAQQQAMQAAQHAYMQALAQANGGQMPPLPPPGMTPPGMPAMGPGMTPPGMPAMAPGMTPPGMPMPMPPYGMPMHASPHSPDSAMARPMTASSSRDSHLAAPTRFAAPETQASRSSPRNSPRASIAVGRAPARDA
ncbi:hypothetical protein MBRA1_002649 [Malassezia brasiliensis]|uniref:Skg3/CAF120-like PH-like domain-containing protein n=1 Tax=Malassezia brasiliensis TaxID=1821822 RepID=A0AAF0DV26_9BASI|nr:hypothetical protein MBRA1_002649 [Malassezia brasiliensis]